eukprot:TRINITY_DN9994_c0_g1_i4.p1 TRINITY_DN9994_c0_g1~~TRINITY_DN9994_c0_g1_i4.p1  ORF type:complete len:381 (+),score=72.84 TRINITY_DN9994_c0_g1_i4:78-1220(+)
MMSSSSSSYRRRSPRRKRRKRLEVDEEGYIVAGRGNALGDDRDYVIEKEIGEGTFGKVFRCTDRRDKLVAVKVVRAVTRYREAAHNEIQVLKDIARRDPDGKSCIVPLLSTFDHRDHLCLAFPVYDMSLFDFLEENNFRGMSLQSALTVTQQCLKGLAFLHRMFLTHTDLKPENIMLLHPKLVPAKRYQGRPVHPEEDEEGGIYDIVNPNIRIIDLGSAHYDWQHHTKVVTTRHYRAPEVILDVGWSSACDVWSLGCILVELYHGRALFDTHDNFEHLAIMEKLLQCRIPRHMLLASSIPAGDTSGCLRWPELAKDSRSVRFVEDKIDPIDEFFGMEQDTLLDARALGAVREMLKIDPVERIQAQHAIMLPCFAEAPIDS